MSVSEDTKQDYRIENINDKFTLMFQQNKEEHLDIKNALIDIKNSITKIDVKMDDRIDALKRESKEKYASKNVEKIVYGMVGVILLTFLYAIADFLLVR